MHFVHGDWLAALAFSGDETRLVATTYGGRLEVWDVTRGVRDVLFCGSESWSAIWASERADRIVVGDAVGAVHFLEHSMQQPRTDIPFTRFEGQLKQLGVEFRPA